METGYSTISERPVQLWISASLLEDRLDAEFYQPIYLRALDSVRSTGFPTRPLVEVCVDKFRVYWGIKGLDNPPSATHIPYIRPNEVADDGWIEYDNLTTIERHWVDDLPGAVVRPGDLLVEVKGNARKVHIVRDDVPPFTFVSGSMYRFVPSDEADVQYLWTYLTSQTCQTIKARLMSNSIIKWINPEDICRLPVPLPPQPVQEYIGAKVRLAERCRTRARGLQEEANNYLDELLGLPSLPPSREDFATWWIMPQNFDAIRAEPLYYLPVYLTVADRLQEIGAMPLGSGLLVGGRYGASVPADYRPGGISFIRGSDLSANRIDVSDLRYLNVELAPKVRTARVRKGDVLITRSGTVGIAAAISNQQDRFAFGSFMIRLQFSQEINPFYAAAFLNSPYGRLQTERQSNGAVQLNINLEEINRILMPVPAVEEQSVIAELWQDYNATLDKSVELVREAKADVEALIEGQLDVAGIVAGRVQPLTWEDLEV